MFLFPGRAPAVQGSMNSARSYLLTYQDYIDIRTKAPHVGNACPLISRTDLHEVSEFATAGVEILGAEPQLSEISYLPLKEGRWLNEMDLSQRRNVIVLGNELLKTLFPGRPSVGAFILLNGIRFEVIGSMPHLGRGENTWLNMRGYIPFPVMAENFPIKGENHLGSISYVEYQPHSTAEHLLAQEDVHKIIGRNHGFDANDINAFDEWDSIQESKMVGTIFDVMNLFLGAVGIVTLALGAIGVINIMLVAVSERTRDRLTKSTRSHKPQHSASFFPGRLAAHPGQRSARHVFCRSLDVAGQQCSGSGRIRSAEIGADVCCAGHWQSHPGRSNSRPVSRA
jgi:putative ABC transport system permease protein